MDRNLDIYYDIVVLESSKVYSKIYYTHDTNNNIDTIATHNRNSKDIKIELYLS